MGGEKIKHMESEEKGRGKRKDMKKGEKKESR